MRRKFTFQNLELIQKKLDKNNQFKDFNKTIGYLIRCVNPDDLEYYDPAQVKLAKKHDVYEELIINTDYGKKRLILDKVVNQKLSEISSNLIWINSRYLIKDQTYLDTLIRLNAPEYLIKHQTLEEKRLEKLNQAMNDIIDLLRQRPRIGGPGDRTSGIGNSTSFSDQALSSSQSNCLKTFKKEFPEKYAKLTQIAPQLDVGKMSKRFDKPTSSAKKLDALDWAKNKKNKFIPGKLWGMKDSTFDEKICMFIQLSGTKTHNGYDKKFINEIRKLRPEWFNSEGHLDLTTDHQLKGEEKHLENFSKIIKHARTNDIKGLKKQIKQPTKVIQSLRNAKHTTKLKKFYEDLEKANIYWFNELVHNKINQPQFNRSSALNSNVNKILKEKQEPSASNKNSPWSAWIYIKRNAKQGDKRYIHAYNEIIKHKPDWKC